MQELRHRLDDVHALLPHAQGHAHRLLPNELQRDLHFQRRLHRQRRLNRAHQPAGVLPGAPAADLLDRAGGHRLQHRRRQMAAGLVHVAEEIARAAAAEPAARAHAHHAPRVVVHDKAQHARLLLHRMHAARPVQRQARRIFLLRRDAPERLHHVFRHRNSSSKNIFDQPNYHSTAEKGFLPGFRAAFSKKRSAVKNPARFRRQRWIFFHFSDMLKHPAGVFRPAGCLLYGIVLLSDHSSRAFFLRLPCTTTPAMAAAATASRMSQPVRLLLSPVFGRADTSAFEPVSSGSGVTSVAVFV